MRAFLGDASSVDISIRLPVSGMKRQTPARTAFWNSLWTPSTLALNNNSITIIFLEQMDFFAMKN